MITFSSHGLDYFTIENEREKKIKKEGRERRGREREGKKKEKE